MAIALSTLGVKMYYTVAADDTIPTSETFIEVPQVVAIPALSASPEGIDVTPLSNTRMHTYVAGLQDLGGALEFTVNLTDDLLEMWNGSDDDDTTSDENTASVMYKYEHLGENNEDEAMWMCVVHPKLKNAVYFQFEPVKLGLPEMAVNSALQTGLYVTPISETYWATKPTDDQLTEYVAPTVSG